MARTRRPSPSEIRMAELCAIRDRPLTDCEIDEVRALRVTILRAEARRRRYANNPDFRRREIERCIRVWRERRA